MTLNVTFSQVDDFAVLFEDANNVIDLDIGSFQYVAIPPILEERTATPSAETQILTPSEGVQGFSKVIVNPIPSNWGRISWSGRGIRIS